MSSLHIMHTTLPSSFDITPFSTQLLASQLVACIQVIPGIESHYIWNDRKEVSQESLIIIKFSAKYLSDLDKLIRKLHPYDTPELIVIEPNWVSQDYLNWANQLFR
ncbi:MAG: divalent-cation tolerance protein CutA [Candidatus Margulisiibacteriota bacterium]